MVTVYMAAVSNNKRMDDLRTDLNERMDQRIDGFARRDQQWIPQAGRALGTPGASHNAALKKRTRPALSLFCDRPAV